MINLSLQMLQNCRQCKSNYRGM